MQVLASRGAGARAEEGQGTLWGGAGGRQGTLFLRGGRPGGQTFFIDFFGRLAACLSQGSSVGQVYCKYLWEFSSALWLELEVNFEFY